MIYTNSQCEKAKISKYYTSQTQADRENLLVRALCQKKNTMSYKHQIVFNSKKEKKEPQNNKKQSFTIEEHEGKHCQPQTLLRNGAFLPSSLRYGLQLSAHFFSTSSCCKLLRFPTCATIGCCAACAGVEPFYTKVHVDTVQTRSSPVLFCFTAPLCPHKFPQVSPRATSHIINNLTARLSRFLPQTYFG